MGSVQAGSPGFEDFFEFRMLTEMCLMPNGEAAEHCRGDNLP
jgi:hypothetical protein